MVVVAAFVVVVPRGRVKFTVSMNQRNTAASGKMESRNGMHHVIMAGGVLVAPHVINMFGFGVRVRIRVWAKRVRVKWVERERTAGCGGGCRFRCRSA